MRHFLRMARWARNPPSESRIKLVLAVIGLGLCLLAIERFVGWPDWLTTNGTAKVRVIK